MPVNRIDLYEYFGIDKRHENGGYLVLYIHRDRQMFKNRVYPATLIIPGGGYEYLVDRESEPVAMAYFCAGFNAFVLEYSTYERYETPLCEAYMAMLYLKENAVELGLDNAHIAVVGLSAGGHLAAMLSNICFESKMIELLGRRCVSLRPNATVLCYPVITMGEFTHESSCKIITGGDDSLRDMLSMEKAVNKNSPPCFIWACADDTKVPLENTLGYVTAYRKTGVPFELHVFQCGGHGLSLATDVTVNYREKSEDCRSVHRWFAMSYDWLKWLGFEIIQ